MTDLYMTIKHHENSSYFIILYWLWLHHVNYVYISPSSKCHAKCVSVFILHRYRAVASFSRVQGVGIPLLTAVEIVLIWVLSFILAVPEAIGFNIVKFNYRNMTFHTCMLKPPDSYRFMQVKIHCRNTAMQPLYSRAIQLSRSIDILAKQLL